MNKEKLPVLKEGEDFYYNEKGLMVLSRKYLLKRGYCCESGCTHCPYGKDNVHGANKGKPSY